MANTGAFFGDIMTSVGVNLTPFSRGMKAAEGKAAVGATKINKALLGIGIGLGVLAVKSLGMAIEFEKAMGQVDTLIAGQVERQEELASSVLNLSQQYGVAATEMATATYQVISAFGDQADTMNIVSIATKAGVAGNAKAVEAVNLLSAVTKGYGDTSKEAVQEVSDLAFETVRLGQTTFSELAGSIGRVVPLAAKLGVEVEELFAGFATLTGVTGNASEVSSQYAAILRAMLKPTEDMQAALQSFNEEGIFTANELLTDKGMVGGLKALIEATDGSDEAVAKLFGRAEALTAVFAITGGQADTFASKFESLKDAAGATEKAFEEVEGTTQHKLNVALAAGSAALIELGELFKPLADFILTTLTPAFRNLATSMGWVNDRIAEATEFYADMIAQDVPKGIDAIAEAVRRLNDAHKEGKEISSEQRDEMIKELEATVDLVAEKLKLAKAAREARNKAMIGVPAETGPSQRESFLIAQQKLIEKTIANLNALETRSTEVIVAETKLKQAAAEEQKKLDELEERRLKRLAALRIKRALEAKKELEAQKKRVEGVKSTMGQLSDRTETLRIKFVKDMNEMSGATAMAFVANQEEIESLIKRYEELGEIAPAWLIALRDEIGVTQPKLREVTKTVEKSSDAMLNLKEGVDDATISMTEYSEADKKAFNEMRTKQLEETAKAAAEVASKLATIADAMADVANAAGNENLGKQISRFSSILKGFSQGGAIGGIAAIISVFASAIKPAATAAEQMENLIAKMDEYRQSIAEAATMAEKLDILSQVRMTLTRSGSVSDEDIAKLMQPLFDEILSSMEPGSEIDAEMQRWLEWAAEMGIDLSGAFDDANESAQRLGATIVGLEKSLRAVGKEIEQAGRRIDRMQRGAEIQKFIAKAYKDGIIDAEELATIRSQFNDREQDAILNYLGLLQQQTQMQNDQTAALESQLTAMSLAAGITAATVPLSGPTPISGTAATNLSLASGMGLTQPSIINASSGAQQQATFNITIPLTVQNVMDGGVISSVVEKEISIQATANSGNLRTGISKGKGDRV